MSRRICRVLREAVIVGGAVLTPEWADSVGAEYAADAIAAVDVIGRLVDADGRGVIPAVKIPFEVVLAPDAIYLSRNFVVNIQHLKFEQPGHFAISVIVDDQLLASMPLHVKYAGKQA